MRWIIAALSALLTCAAVYAGVQNPLLGVPATARCAGSTISGATLVVGFGSNLAGFDAGVSIGSLSQTCYQGYEFISAETNTVGTTDFTVVVKGAHPQNFFSSIDVQDGAGTVRNLTSASASQYEASTLSTYWSWGNASNRVYTAANAGQSRSFTVNP